MQLKHCTGATYIPQALLTLMNDNKQKPSTVTEATSLLAQFGLLENAILTVMWDRLLQRINATSKALQSPNVTLGTVVQLYESLAAFVQEVRNSFDNVDVFLLTQERNYKADGRRKTKPKSFFGDAATPTSSGAAGALSLTLSGGQSSGTSGRTSQQSDESMDGRKAFKIETYCVICDCIIAELKRRGERYKEINERFGVFFDHSKMTASNIRSKAQHLTSIYSTDFDDFEDELLKFLLLCKEENVQEPHKMLSFIRNNKLLSTFPNIEIALRIFMTMPSTNASAERSFSALKRVKSYNRSTMSLESTSALAILATESEITCEIDFETVIGKFADAK